MPSSTGSGARPWIILLGVALVVPSLWIGFWLDDHIHVSAIEGAIGGREASAPLFRFFTGDAEAIARQARYGFYPWWMDDEIRTAFFRPLSELLFRLDHGLFGRQPLGYHVHSLLWWLATLVAAAAVLRRALPGAIGTVALLVLAIDESHLLPAAWISNRNALVALAPALVGLWAHLRWREDGWRPGLYLSIAGFATGLLGGEVAVASLAYVVAYEFVGAGGRARDGRGGGIRRRLHGLAPTLVLISLYGIVYRALGYGAAGSGIYLDPLAQPADFARAAIVHVPALLAGGLLAVSADLWVFAPGSQIVLVVVGCCGLFLVGLLLRSSWPALAPETRRTLCWLVAGSALALVPVAATFPSDRLLLASSLGIAAVLGTILHLAWSHWWPSRRWRLLVPAAVLAVAHLLLAPLASLGTQSAIIAQTRVTAALASELGAALSSELDVAIPANPRREWPADHDLVLLYAPDHVVGIYLPLMLEAAVRDALPGWRLLSLAPYDHRFIRTDERTLEMEIVGGTMMGTLFESLYRAPARPLVPGMVIDRGAMRAEIRAVAPVRADLGSRAFQGPERVAFHIDTDLDAPALLLYAWIDGALREVRAPAVGDTLTVARTLGPAGF